MPLIQNETVTITLNEQEITSMLEEFILNKFYHIKYNSLGLKSVVYSFDTDGGVQCEIIYEKTVKSVESIMESK